MWFILYCCILLSFRPVGWLMFFFFLTRRFRSLLHLFFLLYSLLFSNYSDVCVRLILLKHVIKSLVFLFVLHIGDFCRSVFKFSESSAISHLLFGTHSEFLSCGIYVGSIAFLRFLICLWPCFPLNPFSLSGMKAEFTLLVEGYIYLTFVDYQGCQHVLSVFIWQLFITCTMYRELC